MLSLLLKSTRAGQRYSSPAGLKVHRLLYSLDLASQDTNKDRSAQLGPMKTSKAVDRDATNRDERFSTDANSGKTLPRPASYATITYPYHGQQGPSQQGRIPRLVLAMAALRLENSKTEEMVEKEYEVLDPSSTATRSQHAAALDEDYVLVTSDCDYVRPT